MVLDARRPILKLFALAFVVVGGCNTDLYTKHLAQDTLAPGGSVAVAEGFVDLRYTENHSASFSLLSSVDARVRRPLLAAVQVIGSLLLIGLLIAWRRRRFLALLPFALILAGAIGNAVDRVRTGFVVDFIHIHLREVFHWPIFNFADVLIAAGVGLLALQMLRSSGRSARQLG